MAFVNEFVPEEDIEKYHLKEIMLDANPFRKMRGGFPRIFVLTGP